MKVRKLGIGKSIFLSVLVVFIVFSIIRIYHYSVLKRISDATNKYIESNDYNLIVKIKGENREEILEQYKVGNKYYHRVEYNDSENNYDISQTTILDEQFLNAYSVSSTENELDIVTYSEESLNETINPVNFRGYRGFDSDNAYFETDLYLKIYNWIHYNIMYPAVFTRELEGRECYVFDEFPNVRQWVDKETLLPVKVEYFDNSKDDLFQSVEYEYDKLSGEITEIPNPKDYKIVKYIDNGEYWAKENTWMQPAEEPISGTNLKPGEMLVENLEIKDNEILNFLELTPNEDGIVSLNIYSYDTYNKFRTKYSGLRELTEKDFERYFVSIALKEGYRLSYLQHMESSQANITNILMTAEKYNKDNLTLLVLPKSTGNMRIEYTESNKEIKIDSYIAVENIQKYLNDFSKEYKLKNMDFMGYNNDFVCRLTNKSFAELDYIINPVKGEEPICWRINWCVYRGDPDAEFGDLVVYINAITGEVIGSKALY